MISELQIAKYMNGHSCGLDGGPVLVLAWRNWGKPLTSSARIAAWQAETWTWDVQNMKLNHNVYYEHVNNIGTVLYTRTAQPLLCK